MQEAAGTGRREEGEDQWWAMRSARQVGTRHVREGKGRED